MTTRKINHWLRWIAVLPVALIAGLLSTFPLHWLLYLKFVNGGTILGFIELPLGTGEYLEYMLYPSVIAIVFILVGAKIAPAYKFKTGLVLAALYIIFTIITILLGMANGLTISFGIRSIGPILGILLSLYIVWRESKKQADETQHKGV